MAGQQANEGDQMTKTKVFMFSAVLTVAALLPAVAEAKCTWT
jgi:hypothetical protein